MNLTNTQLDTLKTWLTNNANSTPDEEAAALLNANASPDFWIWRTNVTKGEFTNSVSVASTTFSWTGTGYIGRSQGERDAWREIFNGTNSVNPLTLERKIRLRGHLLRGTEPAPSNRTHLLAVARRLATIGEKLFATGTGSTGSPGTLALGLFGVYAEGAISAQNVSEARLRP